MSLAGVSTATLRDASLAPIRRAQAQLAQAQQDLSSGRPTDPGVALGARIGETASLRQIRARLDAFGQTNALVSTRLQATQGALSPVLDATQSLQKTVIAGTADPAAIRAQAQAALAQIADALNATSGGQYLFAGADTDVKPLADGGASALAAADGAFSQAFGSSPAGSISASDMTAYLAGGLSSAFDAPAFQASISSASDRAVTSRVSPTRTTVTSVSANDLALRQALKAVTMLASLPLSDLSTQTRAAALDQASQALGAATKGIAALQGRVGAMQNAVDAATSAVKAQGALIDTRLDTIEEVDPAALSTRISLLTTQLEASYSLTTKIAALSLVNYLPNG